MRTGIFPKGLEDFSIKLRRDRIFEAIEENLKRASALKFWKEAHRHCLLVDKFHEGVLVHFTRVLRRNWTIKIIRGEFTKF